MLELFWALLKLPGDELHWSIQPKEVKPIILSGLASGQSNTVKLAEECRDSLLKLGFYDFLNMHV
jgi:hypothetical protein